MSDQILAQPELAAIQIDEDSEDLSRSDVILKGALAAGAIYGAVAVGPFVGRALAMAESGDVGILNFALTLEYLESAFYKEAKSRAGAHGNLLSLIELIGRDEEEHVGALTETIKKLGGKPVAEPKFDFPYSGTKGFLKLAQTFEDTGVSAYNGAAPQIKAKEVLEAAGSIVQVEARHAAAIALQNGAEPAPVAFDPALPEAKVLKAVEPFIK
ncbi:MAG TPA: ferritin-like domain-containing protein [Solirubrobacterales bacterium]|nr:ferritin-like domain-containing protein [Solirubrobacterales bacterium]